MARTHLLQAVCTVAMLAAVPAFAQTNTQPADTGAANTPNTPAVTAPAHQGTQAQTGAMGSGMGSMNNSGSHAAMNNNGDSHAAMNKQPMEKSAMDHPHHMMHGKSDMSQDSAVDRLNDQSLQAARSGQPFNASNTGDTSTNMSQSPAPAGGNSKM